MTEELEVIGFAFEGRDMNEELEEANQRIAELEADLEVATVFNQEQVRQLAELRGMLQTAWNMSDEEFAAALQEKGE